MKKLIKSADGAITGALAGMAASHPSRIAGPERPEPGRPWDVLVSTPAPRWER